jgi:hypothetical protein
LQWRTVQQATRSCGTAHSPALDGSAFGVVVGGEMPHWPIRHRAWIGTVPPSTVRTFALFAIQFSSVLAAATSQTAITCFRIGPKKAGSRGPVLLLGLQKFGKSQARLWIGS